MRMGITDTEILQERLLFDHDVTAIGLPGTPELVWDHILLESCVQAVYHHSSLDEHCKGDDDKRQ